MSLELPFKSSERLVRDTSAPNSAPLSHLMLAQRDQYINTMGQLRFGKLLEDLDAFAGTIAYKHCDDLDATTAPLTLVTASCDRIEALGRLPPRDMLLVGACTFVGSSSMNVDVELQPADLSESTDIATHSLDRSSVHAAASSSGSAAADAASVDPPATLLRASFTFVARHPVTNSAVPVPWLHPKTALEKQWYASGRGRQAANKGARDDSLYRRLPSSGELSLVHNMFISQHAPRDGSSRRGAAAQLLSEDMPGDPAQSHGTAHTQDTEMSTHYFTQPCDANIHGKVFGGLLMRQAFELAFSTAWVFTACKPEFFSLDNITFQRPVELGTLLRSTARVEYTAHAVPEPAAKSDGHYVTVAVSTEVVNPEEGKQVVTNDFHFTFRFTQPVPRLLPQSYAEAMTWLEGHRRFKSGQDNANARSASGGAVSAFV